MLIGVEEDCFLGWTSRFSLGELASLVPSWKYRGDSCAIGSSRGAMLYVGPILRCIVLVIYLF